MNCAFWHASAGFSSLVLSFFLKDVSMLGFVLCSKSKTGNDWENQSYCLPGRALWRQTGRRCNGMTSFRVMSTLLGR